jgi:hypothetical protein
MTVETVLSMTESDRTIVTSSAIAAFQLLIMGYFITVERHIELKLSMTHLAGVSQTMCPVGECHGRHILGVCSPVDQDVSILFRWRHRREVVKRLRPHGLGHEYKTSAYHAKDKV